MSRRGRAGCLRGKGRGLSPEGSPEVRFVYLYIRVWTYTGIFDRCTCDVCTVYLEDSQPRSWEKAQSGTPCPTPARAGRQRRCAAPSRTRPVVPGVTPLQPHFFNHYSYCNPISWEALKSSSPCPLFPSLWSPRWDMDPSNPTKIPLAAGLPSAFSLGRGEPG